MTISPRTLKHLATAAVICFALLIVTGGAVRLSGSGLGCPDWPSCYSHRLIAEDSIHPTIEFANRMVSVVVTIIAAVTFLAALLRKPKRRDLTWLSFGLVGGIIGQIVLGGIVVLTKLNPYLVGLHFLLTIAILADALVLRWRAEIEPPENKWLVDNTLVWLIRALLSVMTVLLFAGTLVSGSGPHSGGTDAKRIPVAFSTLAQLHSDIALLLIGMTLATLFALYQARASEPIQRRARYVLELLVLQGALGFTQYFLHDNALVVEIHLAGATCVFMSLVWLYLSLHQVTDEHTAPIGQEKLDLRHEALTEASQPV